MKPVLASLALLLAACGTTPPIQFFSLGPQAVADSAPAVAGPSLVVGPVGVPATIDRLHMVRLVDGVRVEVADGHRWAAPLKTEMARRIASDIARLRGYGRVVAWPQATLAEPDLSLPIDVQRFDAEGFERVTLEAVWTLRKGGKDLASRRFVGSEQVAAPTYAALAAAHGRLIDALARDIATALP
ncbi:MAG: membrane integrity-associated transporter subunit PqiC [Rhodocyclaceae bacterium]|nr:MAG: membrane integrity-associated transporter subunit PqiC [Rhodocyclaceae bacterium]